MSLKMQKKKEQFVTKVINKSVMHSLTCRFFDEHPCLNLWLHLCCWNWFLCFWQRCPQVTHLRHVWDRGWGWRSGKGSFCLLILKAAFEAACFIWTLQPNMKAENQTLLSPLLESDWSRQSLAAAFSQRRSKNAKPDETERFPSLIYQIFVAVQGHDQDLVHVL